MKAALVAGLGLLVFSSSAVAETKKYTPPTPSRTTEHKQQDYKRQDRQTENRRQDTYRQQQNQVVKDSLKKQQGK